jgi:hypothetical protein
MRKANNTTRAYYLLRATYALFFIAFGLYTLSLCPNNLAVERWISPWCTHLPLTFGIFQVFTGLLMLIYCSSLSITLSTVLLSMQAISLVIQGLSIDKFFHSCVLLSGLVLLKDLKVKSPTSQLILNWRLVKNIMGVYFIIIGIDKFFEIITQSHLHVSNHVLQATESMNFVLQAVGWLEIILGLLLLSSNFLLAQAAALCCSLLLVGIGLSVVEVGKNYDIALYALTLAGLCLALAFISKSQRDT